MKRDSIKQYGYRYVFLLSLLLHLLILFIITARISFILQPEKENERKPPQLYVPSYMYTGALNTPAAQQTVSHTALAKKSVPSEKNGILQKSIMDMSRAVIQQDQINNALSHMQNTQPILMIGDDTESVDPLTKLIGISLSAHFTYPRMEGSFGVKGRVLVEMVLHPEGYYTDVKIVRSSNNRNFDMAALYAVNKAPTVVGADRFLSKPKYLIVGFIFD